MVRTQRTTQPKRHLRLHSVRVLRKVFVVLVTSALFLMRSPTLQTKVRVVQRPYNAVTPSTSAYSQKDPNNKSKPIGPVEGRIISISSPLGKQGLFYKLFNTAFRGGTASENMLAVQAPTWEVNPTVPASEFAKHYIKDQESSSQSTVRFSQTELGVGLKTVKTLWLACKKKKDHRTRYGQSSLFHGNRLGSCG